MRGREGGREGGRKGGWVRVKKPYKVKPEPLAIVACENGAGDRCFPDPAMVNLAYLPRAGPRVAVGSTQGW